MLVQVCAELGVAAVVMPEISDILQGRKTAAVCSTLAYLATACLQAGIEVLSTAPLAAFPVVREQPYPAEDSLSAYSCTPPLPFPAPFT